MERFRAEVELAPLLRGEIRIIHMTFERPAFRLDLADLAKGGGALFSALHLDPDRIALERLQVVEGSASVTDSGTGRRWQAAHINAVVEAQTLLGPGKVDVNLALDGRPVAVTADFGRIAPGGDSVTTKLAFRSPDYPVLLTTDGTFAFRRQGSAEIRR